MTRRLSLLLAGLLLGTGAQAGIEDRLRSCAALKSPDSRLLCYDDIARSLGVAPATPAAAEEAPAKAQRQVQRAADGIEVQASTVVRDVYGKLVVELSNGEFWRQVGDERIDIDPGQDITIARGARNAFFFVLPGSGLEIEFTRVD
tara:strand:- start:1852 stop:2289 length:438 start_codon:yes stop_codon:yes gene_type:complete